MRINEDETGRLFWRHGKNGDPFGGLRPAFYFFLCRQLGLSLSDLANRTGISSERIERRTHAVACLLAK